MAMIIKPIYIEITIFMKQKISKHYKTKEVIMKTYRSLLFLIIPVQIISQVISSMI